MTARKEIASSLVVVLFGLGFLGYSLKYPLDTWACPGPGVFPMIVGGFLVVLAVWQLAQAIWKWKRAEGTGAPPGQGGAPGAYFREHPGEKAAVSLIAGFVVYILMMQWVGFFVSTFLFVLFASRLSESRDWWRPVLLSAGIDLFCYLLFIFWLKLNFPKGFLF
jgi:putative tricarboxylic transport membrane protein